MSKNLETSPKVEVIVNTSFEETRIAIMEDGRINELIWERRGALNIVGNIYKATVENVLPGISSAFLNIGYEKNAYLYISDILGGDKKNIDKVLKKGQEVMVQVVKDAIGTKGMKVTMDVTLPGRYLVLTPNQSFVGVSKNIEDSEARHKLNEIMQELADKHLNGMGCIVRTEAEEASKEELEREVKYLYRQWQSILKKFDSVRAPQLLHEDMDAVLQVARDVLSENASVYLLDNQKDYERVLDFVKKNSPELADRVQLYKGKTPIFEAYDIEPEIDNLRKIKLPLPNGGSIIIQEAESLCAIDVNTGKFTGNKSQEETVTQTNIEAANEIAHQLRLRNIGGIIVIDFIDMRKASSRHRVVEALSKAVRGDRAKIRILPITRLGLVEMTRERKRESTGSFISEECPQCHGQGVIIQQNGFFSVQRTCDRCNGEGVIITKPCAKCHGAGRVQEARTVKINIPAGLDTGQYVVVPNMGQAGLHGGPSGDLLATIEVLPHKLFRRDGDDLYCEVPISFATAALGGKVTVPTLDGKLAVTVEPGTQTGTTFRLAKKGIKAAHSNRPQGNLYCTVVVETPVNLTDYQKDLLHKLEQSLDGDEQSGSKTKESSSHKPLWKSFADSVSDFIDNMKK